MISGFFAYIVLVTKSITHGQYTRNLEACRRIRRLLSSKQLRPCQINQKRNKEIKIRQVWLHHRLVAEAFIPNPEGKPQINHKDFNRCNCNVENLEWCTPKENMKHRHDLRGPAKVNRRTRLQLSDSERLSFRCNTKLNYEKVKIIKCLLISKERWIRYNEIAEMFGVTHATIGAINRGLTWSDVTV